jgi:uncharacterized protein YndB with AHSA1/START domain
MLMNRHALIGLAMLAGTAGPSQAKVVDSADNGFTVQHSVTIDASPAKVYRALIDVGAWWHPDHTWSGDAKKLSIEPQAGGCFCEILDGGGSVRHLEVVYADPGKLLRLKGGLGPLQSMGVTGSLSFGFSETAGSTMLTLTYRVGGYTPQGLDTLADVVNEVLGMQLARFENHIKTGKP